LTLGLRAQFHISGDRDFRKEARRRHEGTGTEINRAKSYSGESVEHSREKLSRPVDTGLLKEGAF